MPLTKVGTIEINNVTCDVEVSMFRSGANFNISDPESGSTLGTGDTLDKARAAARIQLNKLKTKVSVEFITLAGEKGVATGLHARNRTILVRIDGKADQVNSGMRYFKPDTPAEKVSRYNELGAQKAAAEREMKEIRDAHDFSIGSAVQYAIDQAQKED